MQAPKIIVGQIPRHWEVAEVPWHDLRPDLALGEDVQGLGDLVAVQEFNCDDIQIFEQVNKVLLEAGVLLPDRGRLDELDQFLIINWSYGNYFLRFWKISSACLIFPTFKYCSAFLFDFWKPEDILRVSAPP